jgi:hypothetical protein
MKIAKIHNILNDIKDVEHVRGCLFLTNEGAIAHAHFSTPQEIEAEKYPWLSLIESLSKLNEVDILFDNIRLYIRKTNEGYLLLILEVYAILSMIKLHCNVLVSQLDSNKPKKLSRFFKNRT